MMNLPLKIAAVALLASASTVSAQFFAFNDISEVNPGTNAGKVSIVAAPAGMSGTALQLSGSQASQMNFNQTTLGSSINTYGKPRVSFQFQTFDTEPAGVDQQPTEFFLLFNGFQDFVGIKEVDEVNDVFNIEVRGGGSTFNPIANVPISFGTVHDIELVYELDDSIDVFVDSALVGSVTGQAWDSSTVFSNVSMVSQKALTRIDNLTFVPEPSMAGLVAAFGAVGMALVRRRR